MGRYQYSLDFFRELFNDSLKSTPADKNLELRLGSLVTSLTEKVFDKVCRGLFEKDKTLFSFVIASQIQVSCRAHSCLHHCV